ncbi:MAG: LysM peptidoglycan-binding domain-containing protein [Chlamydiales bacterium]|nr:LysM peptidoglycan-binding domain-containing protein [Chlamydiales bacterium]
MSRRDTIIIAVLINAGILLVLFATAIPSKDESEAERQEISSSEQVAAKIEPVIPKENILPPIQAADEVDLVLSEWNIKPGERISEHAGDSITYQSAPLQVQEPVLEKQAEESVPSKPSMVAINADSKPQPKADFIQVTVKKGDSLDRIAKANNSTVQEIMTANQLASISLKIGQVLKVPVKEATKTSAKQTNATTNGPNQKKASASTQKSQATPKYYTVKSGDNPWLIANKNNVKLEDLLRLNNLNEDKARKLKPGDKIRIQ